MRGCIQQHKPAALVVTRWVKASRLDAFHMAKGILSPREVALCWVAEEVRRLANNIFTLSLILCPVFHFLRGDRQGNYPPARSQSSYANYRGMAVSEIAEVTPRLALGPRPPGKALSN